MITAQRRDEGRARAHISLFLGGCVVVYAVSWLALARQADLRELEVAATLDLTLFVPLLYWLVLVRGRGWPLVSVLPVFLLSLVGASLMLPAGREGTLQAVTYLAAPAELGLVSVLAYRAARAVRAGRQERGSDALARISTAANELVSNRRAADIVAFEVAVLWYALFSWRTRVDVSNARSFAYHRKCGYGAVVAALLVAIAVEVVPIHALIARWSVPAAWAVTALSLYGALWLIGDLRAVQLRPIVLEADRLVIRHGLRWHIVVPVAAIESIRLLGGSFVEDRTDLRMVLPGARRVAIRLRAPVDASGVYGIHRQVQSFELGMDDPERLIEALGFGR